MKAVKRIFAVCGLIFLILTISYIIHTIGNIDVPETQSEPVIEQSEEAVGG